MRNIAVLERPEVLTPDQITGPWPYRLAPEEPLPVDGVEVPRPVGDRLIFDLANTSFVEIVTGYSDFERRQREVLGTDTPADEQAPQRIRRLNRGTRVLARVMVAVTSITGVAVVASPAPAEAAECSDTWNIKAGNELNNSNTIGTIRAKKLGKTYVWDSAKPAVDNEPKGTYGKEDKKADATWTIRYLCDSPATTTTSPQTSSNSGAEACSPSYTVKSGDGWAKVAKALGMSLKDFYTATGKNDKSPLSPSQVICKPTGAAKKAPGTVPATSSFRDANCASGYTLCADLNAQKIWAQDPNTGAILAGPYDTRSGRPGSLTSTGNFTVQWMKADNKSSTFSDAKMPNTINFGGGNGGQAIHGSSGFDNDPSVQPHEGSCGCINLHQSNGAAGTLYQAVKTAAGGTETSSAAIPGKVVELPKSTVKLRVWGAKPSKGLDQSKVNSCG